MNRRVWLLVLCVAAMGCGSEDEPFVDPMAGTGSAGGNPLVFSFDVEDSEDFSEVTWRSPQLNLGTVNLYKLDEEGKCAFDRDFSLNITYRFPALYQELPITSPWPCAMELFPRQGDALLEVPAKLGRSLTFRFFRDAGVRVDIPNPGRFEDSRDIFVVLRLDLLLADLELSNLEALLLARDLRQKLINNVLQAVVIYLDPTPGDGELLPQERREENVIARFSLLGEHDVDLVP